MGILTTIKLAAVAAIVTVLGFGTYYVSGLRADLALSEANNAKLTQSVLTQKKVIQRVQENFADIRIAQGELNIISEKQRQTIKELNTRFSIRANGTSRDFGDIARAKPGLINKIINRATKKVQRCNELATGSQLKQGETNNECKTLIYNLSQ